MLGVLITIVTLLMYAGEAVVSVGDTALQPVKAVVGVVQAELSEVNTWMKLNTVPVDYSKMND